jgi:hypothetical protein
MDEAENVVENFGVVGFLFEAHQLDINHVETLVCLGQKFLQQIVHNKSLRRRAQAIGPAPSGMASVLWKRLILVAFQRDVRAINYLLRNSRPRASLIER